MSKRSGKDALGMRGDSSSLGSASVGALALAVVGCWFFAQYRIGLNLADEGYLWYGVQRTMLGGVPIRDFLSYDPGRYYWSGLLMPFLGGDGILSLRASVALFHLVGAVAWVGVLARGYRGRSPVFWVAALVCFAVWMFPRHKLFDISISIAVLGSIALHLEHPSSRRLFLSGCVVGFASFFGRNHAAYGLAANILSLLWLLLPFPVSREKLVSLGLPVGAWVAGLVAGGMPLLCFLAFVPGFAAAYAEQMRVTLNFAAYGAQLFPFPNPLVLAQAKATVPGKVRELLWCAFLYGSIAASVYACGLTFWRKAKGVSPMLAASAFTALPYAHIACYWPDHSHLAQSIFSILLWAFLMLGKLPRRLSGALAAVLCCASLFVMLPYQPAMQALGNASWESADVAGDRLLVQPGLPELLRRVDELVERYAPGGRRFLVAPAMPGLYAVYRRQSSMYDSYPLLPKSEEDQLGEIQRIKDADIGFALLVNFKLAGRTEFGFTRTHPLVAAYIQDNLTHLDNAQYPKSWSVFVAR